jgi:hypothetical protein
MLQYHPIRVEEVERLREQRRQDNAAELQRKMLAMLSKKAVGTRQLAGDRSYATRQRAEEGFDADAQAPWRSDMLALVNEMRNAFTDHGKNIFDMTLVSGMFRHVDVDDLVLEDTPLPYPAVYLHFGVEACLGFAEGRWVDGVYAAATDDRELKLVFVTNNIEISAVEGTPLGNSYKNITSCVRTAINTDEPVRRSLALTGLSGDPEIIGSDVMAEAVRMAVNGILYLNLPKADLEEDYPAGAPAQLVATARSGERAEAVKAAQKLDAMGYVKVTFAGRLMAKRIEERARLAGVDNHHGVAPHWRRGHWRRVAHGVGRKERRWHLFDPTVVNASLGTPSRGKIHIVKRRTGE